MKYGRLFLGVAVILAGVWVITGEQLAGASSDAVVNAGLSTIHTPIAGRVSLQQRALGSRVVKGEELGTVIDPTVDTIHLNDLLLDRDLAKAGLARSAALIEASKASLTSLSGRAKGYHEERLAELQLNLDHATARLVLLTEGAASGALAAALSDGTDGSGLDQRLPGVALDYAQERVAVLQQALEAERKGVSLGDSANDALNSQQRLAEARTNLDTLTAQNVVDTARLTAVEARIAAEQLRMNRLGAASFTSTVNGVFWEYISADGENLQRGQDVLRLVDCDSAIVTLSVPENVYRGLVAGQSAKFRLTGESKVYPGTITRLAGAGAATIYRNLAVAPSTRHLERYDVALLVPALRDQPSLRCLIGRTGRVFFDIRPLDGLRSLWN